MVRCLLELPNPRRTSIAAIRNRNRVTCVSHYENISCLSPLDIGRCPVSNEHCTLLLLFGQWGECALIKVYSQRLCGDEFICVRLNLLFDVINKFFLLRGKSQICVAIFVFASLPSYQNTNFGKRKSGGLWTNLIIFSFWSIQLHSMPFSVVECLLLTCVPIVNILDPLGIRNGTPHSSSLQGCRNVLVYLNGIWYRTVLRVQPVYGW